MTITVEKQNDGSINCIIIDNGIGIDQKYHEQVFNVFNRLHSSQEFEGTGIGLALVKKAVETLGGTITLTSAPDKGSSFVLTFPSVVSSSAHE